MSQIKNFARANFSGFQQLAMTLKINKREYNWTQKTLQTLQHLISKLKTGFCTMRNIQSEVLGKVRVTSILVVYYKTVWPSRFCMFLAGLKVFQVKHPAMVLGLP